MILNNTVDIDASPADVFRLINDVERVATCVPGAAITGKDGDTYRGGVKVKVGPITAAYAGTIRFLEIDESAQTLKVAAKGADAHGNGDAEAQVDLSVEPVGEGSRLVLRTDLVISGKIVAFGKGAIVAVSNKILAQFATNLGAMLAGGDATMAPSVSSNGSAPALARPQPASAAPADIEFDALSMLPAPVAKYAPMVAVFTAGMVEGWLIARAFRRR